MEVGVLMNYRDELPFCDVCNDQIGVGEPVVAVINGMLFPSQEYNAPVMLADPDIELGVLQFPNNQLGLLTGEKVLFVHEECYADAISSNLVDEEDDEDLMEDY